MPSILIWVGIMIIIRRMGKVRGQNESSTGRSEEKEASVSGSEEEQTQSV